MTEKELELCVMRAMAACGGTEECSECPLNCEANDESCALYVIAMARDPQGYEIRGGRAVPMTA